MSPFDELVELRSVLTMQEIAEVTGVRRETLSRARPDSRLQRRTQKALDDLYAVVARLRPTLEEGTVHLAAVMRRPQAALAQRSIADLLQEGEVGRVLEYLEPPEPSKEEQLEAIEFDAETLAELSPPPTDDDARVRAKLAAAEQRVTKFLDSDPELASVVPRVEESIFELFGSDARIRRSIVTDYDDPDAREHLYIGIRTDLSFDEEIDRLGRLLVGDDDILKSVRGRLTVGNL